MIICGVVCVGIQESNYSGQAIVYDELLIAIAFAVGSGVLFGVNALIMRHFVRQVGFSAL